MKLEVGDYVRTKNNGVCKLYREFHEDSVDVGICVFHEIDGFFIDKEEINYIEKDDILKSSKNIIDLIELGDLVEIITQYYYDSGNKIYETGIYEVIANDVSNNEGKLNEIGLMIDGNIEFVDIKYIKTILTKEQYENNCYKVEDK